MPSQFQTNFTAADMFGSAERKARDEAELAAATPAAPAVSAPKAEKKAPKPKVKETPVEVPVKAETEGTQGDSETLSADAAVDSTPESE
jgi:hypothetical protein